jgi:hypothetical protein
MREDEFDIRTARCGVTRDQAHDRASRIGGIFQRLSSDTLHQISAACCFERMRIDNSFPAIQFIENWCERGIAKPFVIVTSQESDAIGLQRIERVFDLAKAAVNVGKR